MDGCFSSTGLSGIMVWLNDGNNRCHMMGLVTCSSNFIPNFLALDSCRACCYIELQHFPAVLDNYYEGGYN